ncbi:hypothetical protein O9K51_04787 [Purpureocillium lavendulum]|uniref:Rhodopsin domain-containing protein n=1 Tax=Purpureocillium lavendulum TaxID=1247861 RepID=A0AB34FVZ2_9HYPO|nr:hypothetical protein O9K51_04787 [Purpureocillium lavendulum]
MPKKLACSPPPSCPAPPPPPPPRSLIDRMDVSPAEFKAYATEDQGATLWSIVVTFTVLAQLAVVGRLCARRLKGAALAADDYLICAAVVTHRMVVSRDRQTRFYRFVFYYQIAYCITPPIIKLSLLFLYGRVFPSPRFRALLYATGGLLVVWATATLFLTVFTCHPIESFWTHEGKCMDFKMAGIGYSIVNIGTDFAVWLMPIPIMWRVQLPLAQKIALSIIFLLGLFDCGAALGRPISMLAKQKEDTTWEFASGVKWGIIEICTGIICTCLPAMRTIFSFAWASGFGRTYSHGRSAVRSSPRPNTNGGGGDHHAGHSRGLKSSHHHYPAAHGPSIGDERCLTTNSEETRRASDIDVELMSMSGKTEEVR